MVKEMVKAESYLHLLNDPYGNYVVQKTLAVAEKDDKLILISKIKPEMEELRRISDLGNKIYNKLIRAHPSLQVKGRNAKNKKKSKSIQKKSGGQMRLGNPGKDEEYDPHAQFSALYQSYSQPGSMFPQNPPHGYYPPQG